jgi:putative phage-type endonuclease
MATVERHPGEGFPPPPPALAAIHKSEDEAKFRALRRTGLGGSDIAAVAGLDPYRTVHDVWLEKVGLDDENEAVSEPARIGKLLEPILLHEYARREGVELLPFPQTVPLRDPKRQWIMGTPDAMVMNVEVGVDAKTAGLRMAPQWGPEGSDEIPDSYCAQMNWYLGITGYQRWDIIALIGQEFRQYRVLPNAELYAGLVELGARFWRDYVETRTPPPVDASDNARAMLQRIFPAQKEPLRKATEAETILAGLLKTARRRHQEAKTEEERIANEVRQHIGFADGIEGEGFKITWRRSRDSHPVEWESAYREFRNAVLLAIPPEFVTLREGVAAKARECVGLYTTTKPGGRRLLPKFDGDTEE